MSAVTITATLQLTRVQMLVTLASNWVEVLQPTGPRSTGSSIGHIRRRFPSHITRLALRKTESNANKASNTNYATQNIKHKPMLTNTKRKPKTKPNNYYCQWRLTSVCVCVCVCTSLYTTVVHNTALYSSDGVFTLKGQTHITRLWWESVGVEAAVTQRTW